MAETRCHAVRLGHGGWVSCRGRRIPMLGRPKAMLVFLTQLWMEPKGNLQAHLQPGSASPLETHLFFVPYFLLPPNLAAGPSPAEGRRHSKTSFCQAGLYFCCWNHGPPALSSHCPCWARVEGRKNVRSEWSPAPISRPGWAAPCAGPSQSSFLLFNMASSPPCLCLGSPMVWNSRCYWTPESQDSAGT